MKICFSLIIYWNLGRGSVGNATLRNKIFQSYTLIYDTRTYTYPLFKIRKSRGGNRVSLLKRERGEQRSLNLLHYILI